jgi:REP element-mobilizing transposase RayT
MANSYHQIYLQTVFAVKYRNAVIADAWKDDLHAVIGRLITENDCKSYIVNGVADHVHCFIGLHPKISISDLMQAVKGKSSKWINDSKLTTEKFSWQEGYGCFSYAHSQSDIVYKYVQNQAFHHQKYTFKEEYTALLDKFGVDYNNAYTFSEPI